MKNKVIKPILFAALLTVIIFLGVVLWPRKYNIPVLKNRAGTMFWDLQTGSNIAYTLVPAKGEKKPYPIVFLQGGPGGPIYDSNITLISPLAEYGYDVYLYDQVGCGFSERLENISEYSVDRHKRDLEEIVKLIHAQKVILIGQSWGASLATQFFTDNPENVEKLILTSPGPVLPINYKLENIVPPDSLQLRKPVFTNRQGREKAYSLRTKFVEFCAKALNWKLVSDKEMDDFASYLSFEMGKSTVCDTSHSVRIESGSGYYCMVKTVQSFGYIADKREKLSQCNVPVLIMKGQCDNIKWGYTNEYLSLFPDHQFVIIPNAGHAIGKEQPEIYLKTIKDFLRK
jgi:proline iminopeptidase